ncbi:hypothetical protein GEMRC1_013965 [Eukaryota sp. GEM-RC1]
MSDARPNEWVSGFKNLLGEPFMSLYANKFRERFPYLTKSSSNDSCEFLLTKPYSPESLHACLLRDLVETHTSLHHLIISDVYLTYPSFYTKEQQDCLISAVQYAGLNAVGTLPDAKAATLAYLNHHHPSNTPNKILFIDLGASKLDVTLVSIHNEDFDLQTGGTRSISGDVFDDVILGWLKNEVSESPTVPNRIINRERFIHQLRIKSKEIKHELSTNQSVTFTMKGSITRDNYSFTGTFTRQQFKALTDPLFNECATMIQSVIQGYAQKSNQSVDSVAVDTVLFTGRGCQIVGVRDLINLPRVSQYLAHGCVVQCLFDEDLAVKGAASSHVLSSLSDDSRDQEDESIHMVEAEDVQRISNRLLDIKDTLNCRIKDKSQKLSSKQSAAYKRIINKITTELGYRVTVNSLEEVYNEVLAAVRQFNPSQTAHVNPPVNQEIDSTDHPAIKSAEPANKDQPPQDESEVDPGGIVVNVLGPVTNSPESLALSPGRRFIQLAQDTSTETKTTQSKPVRVLAKFKGLCFYLLLAAFTISLFQGPSFLHHVDLSAYVCPPAVSLDAGTVSFSTRDSTFNLGHGSFGYLYEHEVYFDFDFPTTPEVFVAIHDIDASSTLAFDVFASAVTSSQFTLNIRTLAPLNQPRSTFIDSITVSWVAAGTFCSDAVKSFSSSELTHLFFSFRFFS